MKKNNKVSPQLTKIVKAVLVVMILSISGYSLKYISTLYRADQNCKKATDAISTGSYDTALTFSAKAIAQNSLEPNYYLTRARAYFGLSAGKEAGLMLTYKTLALADMQTAYQLNPHNIQTQKVLSVLYSFLGTADITQEAGPGNSDSDLLAISRNFYEKNINNTPNDVGFYVLFYKYTKRLGLDDLKDVAAAKIMDLRPDLFDWEEDLK